MYRYDDVVTQLGNAGVDAQFFPGPAGWLPPDAPQRVVVISLTAGPGQSTDGRIDVTGLSLRVLSPQNDYEAGESLAWACDRALRRDDTGPWGNRVVQRVTRSGGGPTLTDYDADSRRWSFVLSYLVEAAAEVPAT